MTNSPQSIHLFFLLKAFALQIWITIILLVITSSILVAVMKMGAGGNSFKNLISEHYLYVWGIFCQQGLAGKTCNIQILVIYQSVVFQDDNSSSELVQRNFL